MYDFWTAVLKPNGVKKVGKKLQFTDGETNWGWIRDVKDLYVRACYEEAIRELEGKHVAILEGTPGIGKSLFIFYFIHEKFHVARENNQPIPTFVIGGRSLSSAKKYFLLVDAQGNGVVQVPTPETTPDYHHRRCSTILHCTVSSRVEY